MDEQTIRTLETTFQEFARGREESAALFYERLFANDPALRRLFVNVEMKTQAIKLMAALGLVVGSLRDLARVVPVLQDLAVRHVAYGVEEDHYQTVGTALIQTLALRFGNRFTPDIRAAWTDAFRIVSNVMIDAARTAGAERQAAE